MHRTRNWMFAAMSVIGMAHARAQGQVVLALPQFPAPVQTFETQPVEALPTDHGQFSYMFDEPVTLMSRDGDPLLEEPGTRAPGWFVTLEGAVTKVHLKNDLIDTVLRGDGQIDTVHVPGADLDWTFSPTFELGYRMPHNFGEFYASFNFLTTDGQGYVGTALQKSRFNLNVLDLDYAKREYALGPGWEMRWKVGVRIVDLFFDAQSHRLLTPDGLTLDQRAANFLFGAGPLAGLELWRELPVPGLTIYGRVEGSSIWERVRQHFSETLSIPGTSPIGGASDDHHAQATGVVIVEGGLYWVPSTYNFSHFFAGYHFELWPQIGRSDSTGSWGDFYENSFVFRGEVTF